MMGWMYRQLNFFRRIALIHISKGCWLVSLTISTHPCWLSGGICDTYHSGMNYSTIQSQFINQCLSRFGKGIKLRTLLFLNMNNGSKRHDAHKWTFKACVSWQISLIQWFLTVSTRVWVPALELFQRHGKTHDSLCACPGRWPWVDRPYPLQEKGRWSDDQRSCCAV